MSGELLIFAGTTEGRKLSELLAEAKVRHTVCVATGYGEMVLEKHPLVTIHQGRMDAQEIRSFLMAGNFAAVVDATHPYAAAVTENIKKAVQGTELSYFRLGRERTQTEPSGGSCFYFKTHEACEKALAETGGNILLTTGSKELAKYCVRDTVKKRLFVRVLPGIESISLCQAQGICGKQILAMQGPFSKEMNTALIHQYQIQCLVTKESGAAGGFREKMEAAKEAGIPVFVIGNPETEEGMSFFDLIKALEPICGVRLSEQCGRHPFSEERGGMENTSAADAASDRERKPVFEILLAGTGMGGEKTMTQEVKEAVSKADILLGAKRLIAPFMARLEKRPLYLAEDIIPYLKGLPETAECRSVVILFSGDSGFYSGCQKLYKALLRETAEGRFCAAVKVLPGISSVSALCALCGESWQDAAVKSIHGQTKTEEWKAGIADCIRHREKTFLLLSGAADLRALGKLLLEESMTECSVTAGYQLSYEAQEVKELSPAECLSVTKEGLYTCLIKNPGWQERRLTHGIPDAEFLRDKVPMTKEEIREISICKLKLRENAVVYDIGSGTGSIAVEIAAVSASLHVFAVECKEEAAALVEKNRELFHTPNVTVVRACAPEGLKELPAPTHAFIGGSRGQLKEILAELYEKNDRMRIVMNAVSLETLHEFTEALRQFPTEETDLVSVQVSRMRQAGSYHLMQAENPVWICSFTFAPGKG